MKKVLPALIGILLIIAVIYILFRNKKAIDASTELALARVEVRPVRAVQAGPLDRTFTYSYAGELVASNELMLTAATQGQVSGVAVVKGQPVKKGQVLATVEDDLLREQLEVSRTAFEKLERDLERYSVMLENDAITGQQFETLELNYKAAEAKYMAAQKQYSDTRIKSPIDGVINQLFIKQGSMVGPGVPVCEIVNAENLHLRLRLSQSEAERLSGAENLVVVTNRNDSLRATPGFQSVKPDYAGLYETDLILQETPGTIVAGMPAVAIVKVTPSPADIYIPQEALLGLGGTQLYVYCAVKGKAERRDVKTSGTTQGWVKISAGLQPGDSVITSGNTIISQGDKITVTP